MRTRLSGTRVRSGTILLAIAVVTTGCVKIGVGGADLGLRAGDTGPGGGTVFYVAEQPFPCGIAGDRLCRYLEVAPQSSERHLPWSSPGNDRTAVLDARDILAGSGLKNSLHVARLEGNDAGNSAAAYAAAYEHGGHDDWHLPSADALNELCKYARRTPAATVDTMCDQTGELLPGFSEGTYWSSSEAGDDSAWLQNFDVGNQVSYRKSEKFIARPVRGF